MGRLEDLKRGASVKSVLPDGLVTVPNAHRGRTGVGPSRRGACGTEYHRRLPGGLSRAS